MEKPSQKIVIGVITTLIATAILRFITGFTFGGAFRWLGRVFDACWNFLAKPVDVWMWILILLVLMSLTLVLLIVLEIVSRYRQPSSNDYTKDRFEGLIWRWHYSTSGGIRDPWCFCPRCDGILAYQQKDVSRFGEVGYVWMTDFVCDHCGVIIAELRGDRDAIVDRIRRLIDRKIRVGEWREVIEKNKQLS